MKTSASTRPHQRSKPPAAPRPAPHPLGSTSAELDRLAAAAKASPPATDSVAPVPVYLAVYDRRPAWLWLRGLLWDVFAGPFDPDLPGLVEGFEVPPGLWPPETTLGMLVDGPHQHLFLPAGHSPDDAAAFHRLADALGLPLYRQAGALLIPEIGSDFAELEQLGFEAVTMEGSSR